jgi:diacylglycerol kinase family enzyme
MEFAEKFTVNSDCFNFTVSNGRFLDYLPQNSKPQDGMLDAVVINKLPFREIIEYGLGKKKFSKDLNKLSIFHTKKVTVRSKKPVPVSADGQIIAHTPVTIEVSDQKLKVIVSRKRHF